MKRTSFLFLLPMLLVSCGGNRLNFDKGIIPHTPVNFSFVNSPYDDYNSDLKISWTEMNFNLIFSTNRNSNNNFDFICYGGHNEFDLIDGSFTMVASTKNNSLLGVVNTSSNEFGPFFTSDYSDYYNWMKSGEDRRFFYSSDPNGDLDIFCCKYNFGGDVFQAVGDPFPVSVLNTAFDEGYLTIHSGGEAGRETVYFMSDREGSFDIYRATGEEEKLITESAAVTITRVQQLSSSADDKCPYICGNMLVFTSDREGGFGGFDLWYSVYNGLEWSAPVNLGEDYNTEYDEYRPVVVSAGEGYINDLMIFSSNRPGGKGGFDLYYAGIPRKK